MKYFTTKDWIALPRRLPPQGAYLNVSSLQTLAALTQKAARQACRRLSKAGLLQPLGLGWYASSLHAPVLEEIAGLLARPSYISLDRVLASRGVATQPCHVLTCVTTRPPEMERYSMRPRGVSRCAPVWIDIDFSRLDWRRLERYARRFPDSVRRALAPLRQAQSAA